MPDEICTRGFSPTTARQRRHARSSVPACHVRNKKGELRKRREERNVLCQHPKTGEARFRLSVLSWAPKSRISTAAARRDRGLLDAVERIGEGLGIDSKESK